MSLLNTPINEIESLDQLKETIQGRTEISYTAFQNIDFDPVWDTLMGIKFSDCVFLGCPMPDKLKWKLMEGNNLIFPQLDVPYNPYRVKLYTSMELYKGFDPSEPGSYSTTLDYKIYQHYLKTGRYNAYSIYETLGRRLHDHAITDALTDILEKVNPKLVVAIMGGHSLERTHEDYYKAALISKRLVENGYLMLSGGGPGAMEATHLGAWMSKRPEDDLKKAIEIMSVAPHFHDGLWLSTAFKVMEEFPPLNNNRNDIGIPTWLYGHEPATPFASSIAKYFANSVREEGLLALAYGGIIYCKGSAGTFQEIFQDATQNHYISYGVASPMVFLNEEFWTKDKPIYPLLRKLAQGKEYHELLHVSDSVADIVDIIKHFTAKP